MTKPRSPAARNSASQGRERGRSVIPFPVHRATGEVSPRGTSHRGYSVRAAGRLLRPLLLILALGSVSLGFAGLHEAAWLSYLQVVLGLLGLVEAGSKAHPSRGRRWLLGWGALVVGCGAWLSGLGGWPLWWTIVFGAAFVWSSRRRIFRAPSED